MNINIHYESYESIHELSKEDQILIQKAKFAAENLAYAPYSKFQVGAALRLANGEIVLGSNQENAASPAGICAERTALSVASTLHSQVIIKEIAIFYHQPLEPNKSTMVLSPCGICRQSLMEVSHQQKSPIRILMTSPTEKVLVLENSEHLLPFAFSSDFL